MPEVGGSGLVDLPVVGSEWARAVHGRTASADVVSVPAPDRPTGSVASTQASHPSAGVDAAVLAVVRDGRPRSASSLSELARIARAGSGPLVLVEQAVELDPPALLDLLDGPADTTAALLVDPYNLESPHQQTAGLDRATPARVGADGRLVESSATAGRSVGAPNRLLAGVLRISAADREAAARLWASGAQAAETSPDDPAAQALAVFDLAVLVVVRGGLAVAARSLGHYRWRRGAAHQSGARGSAWQQRLRTSSRGGDGLYSFAVVRRLSRRGTALALRLDWGPNLITVISLAIGLLTAGLILTGQWWAWVVAAFGLQLALVVDCMDGEVARFTRRYSALGAWLDGVGDRVKEYAVFAAVAAVAVRDGQSAGWLLALIAMALVTGRHLEDYAYTDLLAPRRASRPERLALDVDRDARAAAGARTDLGPAPTARARTVFWVKKVVHLPIAERYLLISLLLLTRQPVWVLVGTIAANALALLWALGGRIIREARRHNGPRPEPSSRWGPLDHQLDLGPLARWAGRLGRGPFWPGVLGLLFVWLGVIACLCAGLGPVAVGGSLLAAVITGVTFLAPLRQRFGWLVPGLLWAAEAAVAAALLARGPVGGFVFVFLAAAAYRRYDLIYSVRLNGTPIGPRAPSAPGSDGRIVLVALLLSLAGVLVSAGVVEHETSVLAPGLLIAALLVLVPALVGSARQWGHGRAG